MSFDELEALRRVGRDVDPSHAATERAEARLRASMAAGPAVRRDSRAVLRAAPALVALLLGVALVVLLGNGGPSTSTGDAARVVVPESTLERARALAVAPDLSPTDGARALSATAVRQLAAELERSLPLPPGVHDDLGSLFRPASSGADMGATTSRSDGQMQGQFRAWCTWQTFWLDRRQAGDSSSQRAAEEVLGLAASWPALRGGIRPQVESIAQAAQRDQPGPVQEHVAANCRGVPTG